MSLGLSSFRTRTRAFTKTILRRQPNFSPLSSGIITSRAETLFFSKDESSPSPISSRSFSSNHRNASDSSGNSKRRPDPLARRPNQKCDPYGQGGKPLTKVDAERLLLTVDGAWKLDYGTSDPSLEEEFTVPVALTRTFAHVDFISASNFLTHLAAVAQMNDHYPSLHLERTIVPRQKSWKVVTTVRCHTRVLEGLSHHDFFLATLMDVEIQRPEVAALYLVEDGDSS